MNNLPVNFQKIFQINSLIDFTKIKTYFAIYFEISFKIFNLHLLCYEIVTIKEKITFDKILNFI